MSQVFFDELELPRPDVNLEVGSGAHAQEAARGHKCRTQGELERIVDKRVRYAEPQAGNVRHTSADCSRALTALGYARRVRLADGLRAEVEWMCSGQEAGGRGQWIVDSELET